MSVVSYILSLNKEDMEKEIRRRKEWLFKEENHYEFVWLVQGMKEKDILLLLNDEILPYLFNDKNIDSKLNAIMTCGNEYVNDFLANDEIIEKILEHNCPLSIYTKLLDIRFGSKLLEYVIKNPQYIMFLGELSDKVQEELFSNSDNINKLLNLDLRKDFVSIFQKNGIYELLKYPKFLANIKSCNVDIFNILVEKGITIPNDLIDNSLLEKYANIVDINKYRNYMIKLSNNNMKLKDLIETKRKKKYLEEIKSIDLNLGLLNKYKIVYEKILNKESFTGLLNGEELLFYKIYDLKDRPEEVLKVLKLATEKKMLEMTIDMYYEDITFNTIKNMETMVNYYYTIGDTVIPKERIKIYEQLINYEELNVKERIDLFLKLNDNQDHVEELYDDFRNSRNHSYQKIKDSLLDFSKLEENTMFNSKYGVPLYKLEGEPFYSLIHHTLYSRTNKDEFEEYKLWSIPKPTMSLSLIGDKNITTFRDSEQYIIVGFNNINIDNIMHVFETDSYSNKENSSNRVQRLYKPEDLMENTKGYNEILIKDQNFDGIKTLKPDYVVCYDRVKMGDLLFAQKMNIPIVKINTSKYQYSDSPIESNSEKYIDNYSASLIENYHRKK